MKLLSRTYVLLVILLTGTWSYGQSHLSKVVPIQVASQPVDHVLEILSNKGNFYFSYNSNIINRDSLVTISENNRTVRQLLDLLFKSGFEYRESGNYIIIRRAPIKLTLVTSSAATENNFYTVSGYIIDDQTGEKVSYASVYEKQRLASAITNEKGYFKIRLKSKYRTAALTVSKEFYQDTTVVIEPRLNQQITITIMPLDVTEQSVVISPKNYQAPDSIMISVRQNDSISWLYTYRKTDSVRVEKTRLGDWFISSKLKFQSLNLSRFFTVRPYQLSVIPGVSTNGKLNSQVVNHFSFNLFGGFSGGVNGLEVGGLFNINKRDVKYVQVGGLFNVGGGAMTGVQTAGIHNTVLKAATGVQVAGVNNYVQQAFTGLQVAGVYSHTGSWFQGVQLGGVANYVNATVKGIQIAGVSNYADGSVKGMQIGGVANINPSETKGMQIAGIVNYSRKLRGVQIGLINIADTSEGYSIGLINVVLKGYHKLVLSTNDIMTANVAFKTGNSKLYSILLGGANVRENERIYSFGYGLGKEMNIAKWFSVNPEFTAQHLYLGSWDYLNLLGRATLNFNIKFGRHFAIFGGPAFNAYHSDQTTAVADYKFDIIRGKQYKIANDVTGWVGWNAGISLF